MMFQKALGIDIAFVRQRAGDAQLRRGLGKHVHRWMLHSDAQQARGVGRGSQETQRQGGR